MAEENKLPETDAQASQEQRRRVGDILRSERLSRDMDLKAVADTLRIRRAFLEAIENSRPQDLPGMTYALGFVRTYAEHLDLDAKSLVDQYKAEADELEDQTKLHFPEPLPAKSLPGGALVFIGLLLLAIFYGVWWYLNNQGKSLTELVPGVPERFSALLEEGEAEPMASSIEPQVTEPVAASDATGMAETTTMEPVAETPETTSTVTEDEAAVDIDDSEQMEPAAEAETAEGDISPAVPEETAATAAAEAPPAQSEPQTEAAPDNQSEETETADEVQETATAGETATDGGDAPAAQETAAEVTEETVDAVAETTEQVEEAATASPAPQPQPGTNNKVFGEENTDARIVITAKSTAWVEISGPGGERLLTRLMNKGDQYRVPNQQGITLVTGNAGALEVSIDGNPGTPLGPNGAVRRDVSLDPDALLAAQ